MQSHHVPHTGKKLQVSLLGVIFFICRLALLVQEASRGRGACELSHGCLPLGLHRAAGGGSLLLLAHARHRGLGRRRRCQSRCRCLIPTRQRRQRSWHRRRPRSGGRASSSPRRLRRAANTQTSNAASHTTDRVVSPITPRKINGRSARQNCTLKHLLRYGQAAPSRFRGVPHQ